MVTQTPPTNLPSSGPAGGHQRSTAAPCVPPLTLTCWAGPPGPSLDGAAMKGSHYGSSQDAADGTRAICSQGQVTCF